MKRPHDSRWLINASIITLALFVFALTLDSGWSAYREYHAAQRMARVNALVDQINRAAALFAAERGLSSAALGTPGSSDGAARQRIGALREQSEDAWRGALTLVQALDLDRAGVNAVVQARRAHQELETARARLDASLRRPEPAIGAGEWIGVATAFIAQLEQLSQTVCATPDPLYGIGTANLTLKHWVWLAAEHAGLERGQLAHYIAGHQPLPRVLLDQLQADRGVVEQAIAEIRGPRQTAATDARVQYAIDRMDRDFLGGFEQVRQRVYAGAATGGYPFSAGQWLDQATAAIDTILAVGSAVSEVADARARGIERSSYWHLWRHISLIGFTLVLVVLSLTRVRRTANALFREKELAEVTLHCIGDAVITTDAAGHIEYLNPTAEELTGWRNAEAQGRPLGQVFTIVDGYTRAAVSNPIEECLREGHVVGLASNTVLIRRDHAEFSVEDSAAPIRDREGRVVGAVMVFYDVSQMRNNPHLLSYYATHDTLTGLINRREFERQLSDLLVDAKRFNHHHCLCYADLDQFKVVNDTCGHIVGDKLLRQLTYLLREQVRDADTLARLGGDEFGLLLRNCPLDRALHIAEKLREQIKDFRFTWQDKTFDLGGSIGLVPITPDSVSPVEILSEADAACYAAKEKGRNRVQVYQPDDLELARRHGEMQWVSRIGQALQQNRFELHCQLIAPLGPGEVHHEVLLRLRDADGQLVPPMSFIPAAERYNLMPEIDRWVIRSTLDILDRCGCATVKASQVFTINLSGASLGSADLLGYIRAQLAAHRIDARRICFEITETAAIANLEQAAEFMKALKIDGCRFALDDFGSGLSSFMYLKMLPVDYLKIDGGFIRGIIDDPIDLAMVDAINTIGHVMGIQTIAEFVENEAILSRLRQINVDYAQGYGVARPQPLIQCLPDTEVAN